MIPLCFENYKMELAVVYLRQVHLLFLFPDCFLYFIQIGTYGKPHTFAVRRRIIFPSKNNLTNRSKTKSLFYTKTGSSCFSLVFFHGYCHAIQAILRIAHTKSITFSKTLAATLNFKDSAQFLTLLHLSV